MLNSVNNFHVSTYTNLLLFHCKPIYYDILGFLPLVLILPPPLQLITRKANEVRRVHYVATEVIVDRRVQATDVCEFSGSCNLCLVGWTSL